MKGRGNVAEFFDTYLYSTPSRTGSFILNRTPLQEWRSNPLAYDSTIQSLHLLKAHAHAHIPPSPPSQSLDWAQKHLSLFCLLVFTFTNLVLARVLIAALHFFYIVMFFFKLLYMILWRKEQRTWVVARELGSVFQVFEKGGVLPD